MRPSALRRQPRGAARDEVVEHLIDAANRLNQAAHVGAVRLGFQDAFETHAARHATHYQRRKLQVVARQQLPADRVFQLMALLNETAGFGRFFS